MKPYADTLPEVMDLVDVALIERIAAAIGTLNSTYFTEFSSSIWHQRATWQGYARAAKLQGFEIDEIDVISWATSVAIPGRIRQHSLTNPFDGVDQWERDLGVKEQRHWREDLPFAVRIESHFATAPKLLRAVAVVAQYARIDQSIRPWLHLPILIHRMGLSSTPLPCLVAGDKALRFERFDTPALLRPMLRDLAGSAEIGVDMMREIESERRQWLAALSQQRKPGALRLLAALSMRMPVLKPEQVARTLGLTTSGAGKLLDRAAGLGLLQEVSERRSWRVYMVPSLARRLGFAPARRGRPRKPPPLPGRDGSLGASLAAFDAEMAAFSARFPGLGNDAVASGDIARSEDSH